jgi:hypothetical protein
VFFHGFATGEVKSSFCVKKYKDTDEKFCMLQISVYSLASCEFDFLPYFTLWLINDYDCLPDLGGMNLGEGSNPQELQLVALHRELTFQVTLLLLFALVVLQHR